MSRKFRNPLAWGLVAVLAATAFAALKGFAAPRKFDAGTTLASLVVGNFDGDSGQDFAVGDRASPNNFTVFLKDPVLAPGTPYGAQTYRSDSYPMAAPIDDLAKDFDPHPQFAMAAGGQIYVVANAGRVGPTAPLDLTFRSAMSGGAGIFLDHVIYADWNGDGAADILATGHDASSQGVFAAFLNDVAVARGTYKPAVVTTLAHPATGLSFAQFNADSKVDVIVVERDDKTIEVLNNDGANGAFPSNTITLPFRPVAAHAIEATSPTTYLPELFVVGTGRNGSDTANTIEVAIFDNRSTAGVFPPSIGGAVGAFTLATKSGPAAVLPTAIDVRDIDGDGKQEAVILDSILNFATIVKFTPTLDGAGTVTAWDDVYVAGYPCGADPRAVAFSNVDGGSYDSIVTANGSGAGANVLLGGQSLTTLQPTASLTFALAKGTKYAAVATGATVKNGSDCRFSCRNANVGTPGVRIRVQSTTTPEVEGSWTDLPGASAGAMGQDAKTGDYVLYQQNFPIGAQYFRTVSYAPGATDGLGAPIGPFTIEGGQPARLLLFSSITRPDGSTPTSTRPGETLRVKLTFRNEGDEATAASDLWAQIPAGCTVSNPNGGKQKLAWMTWTKIVVPGHSGDVTRTFDVTVGGASTIGGLVESRYTAMASKLKLAIDKHGALKPVKDGVAIAVVNNSVPILGDLSVTITPTPTSQRVGRDVTVDVAVTNNTTAAISNVRFVEHLRRDVEGSGGAYIDAAGHATAGTPDIDSTGTVYTFTWPSVAAGATVRAQIYVHSTWDHEASGTITVSDHELLGTLPGGGAAATDPHPLEVTVAIDQPAADPAPRLQLSAGLVSIDHPDPYVSPSFGDLPFAYPGESVQYVFLVENVGHATAHQVALHAFVPAGLDLDMSSFSYAFPFQVTSPSGAGLVHGPTTVTVQLLNVPDDGVLRFFGYRCKVRDDAGAPTPGTILTTDFGSLTSNSFRDPAYMRPEQLRLLVPEPMRFEVRKAVSASGLAQGETMTLSYDIVPTGAFGAQAATAAFGFPKYEECVGATLDGVSATETTKKGLCTFALGDFAKDQTKRLVVTVRLTSLPPATANIVNTLSVSGLASTKAAGASPAVTLDVETTNVCDPSRACLCVAVATNAIATTIDGGGPGYLIAVGNLSGTTAKKVVIQASTPAGVRVTNLDGVGASSEVKSGFVIWKVAQIPPHSAVMFSFELAADIGKLGVGDTVVSEVSVSADNAPTKVSGRLATSLYTVDDAYGSAAGGRQLLVSGVPYKIGGNADVDAAFAAMNSDTLSVQLRGADFTKLADDVLVIPLGGGNVLGFGTGNTVFASPGGTAKNSAENLRRHHGTDVWQFATGPASSVTVRVSGCQTVLTAGDALGQIVQLVPCKTATVVSNGGGNLVDLLGARLVSYQTGLLLDPISLAAGAGVVAQGGGNVVAAGGGNIVAAGGGNVVAAGGGNLAAQGLASLVLVTPAMVVAAGGGNVVAAGGGNVVAQGGGNVVAAGGGNVVAAGGGNVVAAGGGNVVAQGGGNVVAAGGGNVVAAGGGNVVAAGGGNVVAAGGGN